jgi:hypothetical protein
MISVVTNGLYFVRISGLCLLSFVLHNHCFSSNTPLPPDARHIFRLLQRVTIVTFTCTHTLPEREKEAALTKYNKKKKNENRLLFRSLAYKEMKDKMYHPRDTSYHCSLRFLYYYTLKNTNLWFGRLNCPELVFTVSPPT